MADARAEQQSGKRRAGAVCTLPILVALVSVLLTASPSLAATAHASEPEPASPLPAAVNDAPTGTVMRAPESVISLQELLREGMEYTARGNLEGADAAWAKVREIHPGHPAAPIFEMNTLQARRSLDFQNTEYDDRLYALANEALKSSRAWIERAPDSAQAHFYAGQALFELTILDGMHKRYLRAGRQGEEARKLFERALELDPDLVDAKLPLGSYYYYASLATRYIRFLTWLWFVPMGEKDLGLEYIQEAARNGDLTRFDAGTRLARFYLYFEEDPEKAEPILEALHRQYPENSYLHFEIVELRMLRADYDGTVEKALELEQAEGDQWGDGIRRVMARIWRARAELFRGNSDQAEELLAPLESGSLNEWSQRWLLLTRGNVKDLRGERKQAVELYEQVIDSEPLWASGRTIELAKKGLKEPFQLNLPAPAVGSAAR